MTLYRYGWMAWVWRSLMLLGVGFGIAFVWMGALDEQLFWFGTIFGLGFAAFPLILGQMVATRVDQRPDGLLRVHTLNLTWRTIDPARLGQARYRSYVQSDYGGLRAPRIWVPVRGGPPIFLDLLAHIPDPDAFRALFPFDDGSAPRGRPRRRGRKAPGSSSD